MFLRSARAELIALLLFALVLLGIGIGLRDPWPSDEPRFALVARWMVEHGQWLFPHRGHELYPDKPPVFMWLQAFFYLIVRSWRVAFLLPSLLSGLMTLGLVYDLGRRLWNHRSGLLAAAALLLTIHFTYQFRNAQIDPLEVGWITLANYGLLRHLLLGPNWRWFAVGCFFAGVGVITKGVGVLALLMLAPFLFARWRGWRHLALPRGGWRWAGSLALFLVPILAWLVPMVLTAHLDGDPQHAAYVQNILFGQTVHRYATPTGHIHSPFYFLGIMATDWLPLALLLPWAIPAWWRRLKRRDARYLLPLGWWLLVLMFFSLSPGKRDVYILPALPMVALAMGPLLPGLLRKLGPRRALFGLTLLLASLLSVAAALAMTRHPHWAMQIERSLDPRIWRVLLAIGVSGLLAAALFRVRRAALGWAFFALALWSLYGLWGYPILNGDRSALDVMQRARQLAGPQVTLGLVAWKEQNLLMAQGPVAEFGFLRPWSQQYRAATHWLHADPSQRRLFMLQQAMGDCVDRAKATHIGHANRREWWLVPADALVPGCVPADGRDDD
ncbi:ArnT family glycosyltransferase [Oleiagrimonas soli]|uniref:Dolichyl-phosphate-mannose-protein mannosyltransferase n=1 Tax=Oleiagrimonas soli TaxID=1543381 RepID=A0A099CT76_9GAMM|nr:glycosyltransferase family 39 protein [Oleiagrimonas soli]KGI76832.1 dolichyl-phosphate-mannose-protein mannosyltransferase [Oleiagrimonas soli]